MTASSQVGHAALGLIAVGLLASAYAAPPHAASLAPRDECAADKSFVAYRERLRAVVARRDADTLLALVSPNIMTDFGGGSGRPAFIEHWELKKGRHSPVWRELEMLLRLGCVREGDFMEMPYFFQHLPDDADPTRQLMIIGANVPLRAKPDREARILTRLSWEYVEAVLDTDSGAFRLEGPWVKVSVRGHTGYVVQAMVRHLLDYRAAFEHADSGWRMSALVAGD